MAKVIVTIDDEQVSQFSDETRELFFEALQQMTQEVYSRNTGKTPDIDEMYIDSYEVDIKVITYIEDGETFDDDQNGMTDKNGNERIRLDDEC